MQLKSCVLESAAHRPFDKIGDGMNGGTTAGPSGAGPSGIGVIELTIGALVFIALNSTGLHAAEIKISPAMSPVFVI